MQANFGYMGVLNIIADWIMRLSMVNLLWFLINAPAAMLIFFIVISPTVGAMLLWALPLLLAVIFLFFPSTVAVFAIHRDWVLNKEVPSIWKVYWRHFKQNYKPALSLGLILTLMWLVWTIDYFYLRAQHDIFGIIFIIIGVIFLAYTLNVLSVYVHFDMNKKDQLKNAFMITFGSPLLTIVILLATIIVLYLSVRFWFVLLFFTMSIISVVSFYLFYRFTLKVNERMD